MTDVTSHRLDYEREARLGIAEAILCESKAAPHLAAIVAEAAERGHALLLTRLSEPQHQELAGMSLPPIDYDPISRTGMLGAVPDIDPSGTIHVEIVAAGTSDLPVALEAQRTLRFHGVPAALLADVGAAGLHRLLAHRSRLEAAAVTIVCAGMDAVLPTIVGGLVGGAVIAVPTSVGYGVAAGGHTALHTCLASCAPGVTVVNIDNGFGAACAAMRILTAARRITG
jgi:NCAIR mutase (PurE)-related protein